MEIKFEHRQSAHCENGVTANLLRHHNIHFSEPLVFGIGSGIFFSHMPFIKVNSIPVTSFRPLPGAIFKRVSRRLGLTIVRKKFNDPKKSMEALDQLLERGIPVGMLVGVYYLSYFPEEYRFHFNAHNIVVFGKKGDNYIISDPVMENVETLTYDELLKVRYARGTYPPKGRMYYIEYVPKDIDINKAIISGIKMTCRHMLETPLSMFGIKGIRYMSRKLRHWPEKLGEKLAGLYVGQVIRMLEEIGTGGAGFRFMYAAFLEESSRYLNNKELMQLSGELTKVGDQWRDFALRASRTFKQRKNQSVSYDDLADQLIEIAAQEDKVFKKLKSIHL